MRKERTGDYHGLLKNNYYKFIENLIKYSQAGQRTNDKVFARLIFVRRASSLMSVRSMTFRTLRTLYFGGVFLWGER